jgi:rsbT co-antagonist protein RsbR
MSNSQPSDSAVDEPLAALNRRIATLEAQLAEREASERELREQLAELRGAQTEQREHEMRLRVLLDNLPIIVYTLDPAGNFTFSDGKALEMLGFRANQVVGRSAFDIYKRFPSIIESLHRAFAGEPNHYENQVGPSVFDNWMRPLYNARGELVGVFGAALDITERKRAQEAQASLQNQVIQAQEAALRELSTPLIPISDGVVAMPLIGSVDSGRAQQVIETLLTGVAEQRATTVILDITGVPIVDTQVANALIRAAQAVKLLGAKVILTGIRPEVAQTLVGLGVDLSGISTLGTLQSGIAAALRRQR